MEVFKLVVFPFFLTVMQCFPLLLLFFKLPVQVHNLPVLLFGCNIHVCLLVCMTATTTAFVSPSVLVGDDVSAAAIAVPVVVVVLLLVIGVVVLGMGLCIYYWKKGLRESRSIWVQLSR